MYHALLGTRTHIGRCWNYWHSTWLFGVYPKARICGYKHHTTYPSRSRRDHHRVPSCQSSPQSTALEGCGRQPNHRLERHFSTCSSSDDGPWYRHPPRTIYHGPCSPRHPCSRPHHSPLEAHYDSDGFQAPSVGSGSWAHIFPCPYGNIITCFCYCLLYSSPARVFSEHPAQGKNHSHANKIIGEPRYGARSVIHNLPTLTIFPTKRVADGSLSLTSKERTYRFYGFSLPS